jgi:superfamily II DNA or RNA helicase
MKLRPYQEEAAKAIDNSWNAEFARIVLISPTGSGKTIIVAEVTDQRKAVKRILFIAHRDELIDQAIDKLRKARGIVAAKEKAADRASLDAAVVVASVETLARHNESVPAAPRQLGYLFYLGYRGDTRNISKAAAGRLIAQIKAHQPEHAL